MSSSETSFAVEVQGHRAEHRAEPQVARERLHGSGERGTDNVAQLKNGLATFATPAFRRRHRCIVGDPHDGVPPTPEGDPMRSTVLRSAKWCLALLALVVSTPSAARAQGPDRVVNIVMEDQFRSRHEGDVRRGCGDSNEADGPEEPGLLQDLRDRPPEPA